MSDEKPLNMFWYTIYVSYAICTADWDPLIMLAMSCVPLTWTLSIYPGTPSMLAMSFVPLTWTLSIYPGTPSMLAMPCVLSEMNPLNISWNTIYVSYVMCTSDTAGVGFGCPKPVFPRAVGKTWEKLFFPCFGRYFTAKNWGKLGKNWFTYDVAFRWWIFNTYKKTTHYIH